MARCVSGDIVFSTHVEVFLERLTINLLAVCLLHFCGGVPPGVRISDALARLPI